MTIGGLFVHSSSVAFSIGTDESLTSWSSRTSVEEHGMGESLLTVFAFSVLLFFGGDFQGMTNELNERRVGQ